MKRGGPLRRITPLRTKRLNLTRSVIKASRPKVTPQERAARKLIRHRSGGICEVCAGAPATNVQHRLAKAHGGPWTASNGLAVCGHGNVSGCHGHIHQNPIAATQQGWTIRSSDRRDPADVPCWLAGYGYAFLNPDGSITESEEEEAS